MFLLGIVFSCSLFFTVKLYFYWKFTVYCTTVTGFYPMLYSKWGGVCSMHSDCAHLFYFNLFYCI